MRLNKNSREIHIAPKKIIENSQKILIKIHLKIHTRIRTEKKSPEKNSRDLGTGIPDMASNFGILFWQNIEQGIWIRSPCSQFRLAGLIKS